ncbi:MAG: type II toxin-antitoxin system PemK/MazF family toxin [Cyclobacteriaceae bacterium]|nr:type II toxin-antitoxin system PemK/MazF family toxin [Cyclobacteriaceae bacterium]
MKQGEIWYANLNPSKGSEQAGFRPVVIVSGNLLNELLPVVIVMPLTTKIKKYKGNPILQPTKSNGLKDVSEMLVFHIRSISKDRLVERIGNIETEELQHSIRTLNDILKY